MGVYTMLNIAIVDDEPAHRDILTKYIEEWKKHKHLNISLETFDNGEAFYFLWCQEQRCDVLFLDIMMDKGNGISLARKLREKGTAITIIFTTGIADYMQEGYEVEAMHYLLKPLDKNKVWECLEKCMRKKSSDTQTLLLPTEDGLIKINTEKLCYVEAMDRYCHLSYENEPLRVKVGIREMAAKLEQTADFMFCHRSYLVNIRKISKVGRQDLIMDNGDSVPVSRRLYKKVYEQFIKIMIGDNHL